MLMNFRKLYFNSLKMPLVNYQDAGIKLTNKQKRNLKQGDGIFSAIGSLIAPAVNLIKTNADVIKTGASAASSLANAGKSISDAVNLNKKTNAEIDQMKRALNFIKSNKYNPQITLEKQATPLLAPKNIQVPQSSSLTDSEKNAIARISKKGKGFKIYP